MRILYIATDIGWGGSSVALYNIIAELKERHQIFVLLPTSSGRMGHELQEIGIKVFEHSLGGHQLYPRFHTIKEFIKHNWWFVRDFFRRHKAKLYVAKLLDEIHPDIVHVNVGPIDISLDACLKRNICHIWHLREYQDRDFSMHFFPSKSFFRKRISTNGNYCISISKDIFSHWGLRPEIDRVIYDGVIISGTKPLLCEKEKYFLFVGRIQKTKGVIEAIKAFHCFSEMNKDYKLLIAGNWDTSYNYKRLCDKYVQQNGIGDKVIFLGQRKDIALLMAKATALLVPSYCEGFGFITAEAMYNNCVVIGRNTGGTKEQFDVGLAYTGKEI